MNLGDHVNSKMYLAMKDSGSTELIDIYYVARLVMTLCIDMIHSVGDVMTITDIKQLKGPNSSHLTNIGNMAFLLGELRSKLKSKYNTPGDQDLVNDICRQALSCYMEIIKMAQDVSTSSREIQKRLVDDENLL